MERGTILVVDDEPNIADLVELYLRRDGFRVVKATTGEDGVRAVGDHRPRLVVLDVGLPDIDGLEVCRRLRQTSTIPVIFLTARDTEIDRVLGLELGADDYVTKPFSPPELVARVKAVLRRADGPGRGRAPPGRRRDDRPRSPRGPRRRRRRSRSPPRSSTCSTSSPSGPASRSAGSRSSTACGATTGSATPAPSTCTSRRCARSSTTRCASTPCAASATASSRHEHAQHASPRRVARSATAARRARWLARRRGRARGSRRHDVLPRAARAPGERALEPPVAHDRPQPLVKNLAAQSDPGVVGLRRRLAAAKGDLRVGLQITDMSAVLVAPDGTVSDAGLGPRVLAAPEPAGLRPRYAAAARRTRRERAPRQHRVPRDPGPARSSARRS